MNFAIRGIKDAEECLSQLNIGQTRARLNNARWQAREAKKVLSAIGAAKTRTKTTTKQRHSR